MAGSSSTEAAAPGPSTSVRSSASIPPNNTRPPAEALEADVTWRISGLDVVGTRGPSQVVLYRYEWTDFYSEIFGLDKPTDKIKKAQEKRRREADDNVYLWQNPNIKKAKVNIKTVISSKILNIFSCLGRNPSRG